MFIWDLVSILLDWIIYFVLILFVIIKLFEVISTVISTLKEWNNWKINNLTVWNPVRFNLYIGGITLRMYTKIALTIAVTIITTKLVLHIEEQRKIRNLHNSINKLIDSKNFWQYAIY